MGLYDRDYMRDDEPARRPARPAKPWSPTITLLVVLGLIFLIQSAFHLQRNYWIEEHFALSLDGIKHGHVWQLLTFQFLHGGLLHILLNGFTLYSLGLFMEETIGRRRFLGLYFLSGVAGGVLQVVASLALQHNTFVVGASAGIAGLLGAFAAMFPHRHLTIFLLVFPVTVRAQVLLWILVGLSLLGTVIPFGGVAHAAHLGGLLAGVVYVRFASRRSRPPRRDSASVPPFLSTTNAPPRSQEPADFIAREVDPILEKIATHGIQSLTERERKILEAARARMGRR